MQRARFRYGASAGVEAARAAAAAAADREAEDAKASGCIRGYARRAPSPT